MHEMGITAEVLTAVTDAANKAGAVRVNRVRLTIGELTAIVPESLQFAWDALTPGTIVEGATLEVARVGARSRCLECGAEWDHDQYDRLCPACGSFAVKVLQGDELRIDDVDVDLPGEAPAATAAGELAAGGRA